LPAFTPSVPAAVDSLLAILRAWPDLAGADIRDSQQTPDESNLRAVFVGDTNQLDDAGQPVLNSADYVAVSAGLGGRLRETYSLHCCAASQNGDGDYAAARRDAYALAAACGAAIEAHPNLAGAIQGRAIFGGGALRYQKLDVGIRAVVLWDADVEAFTTG